MSGGDGCCKKNENMEGVCHKPKESPGESKKDHCPQPKNERSCICICCFQYAAPELQLIKFGDSASVFDIAYNLLTHRRWLDPLLAGPWQPPDLA